MPLARQIPAENEIAPGFRKPSSSDQALRPAKGGCFALDWIGRSGRDEREHIAGMALLLVKR
ncbi:hypothetical protein XH98_35190 [Bradyrhizobium sp. CCBAU 51745]|nr:hypothetical protein [Bradyrhizobium sp. CCBAU 45384]MDA9444250.1 hypothetical protein [Bradyrhizobium sp. CCBAU 51745]